MTVLGALATSCGGTVPAGTQDSTPPQFKIEFRDLPAQGLDKTPNPTPDVYINSIPTIVNTILGETYTIVAKLEDPDSGVQFLELVVLHSEAECLSPTGIPLSSPPSTEKSFRRTSGQTGSDTSSPNPTTWPTQRFVSLSVTISYKGGCPQGQQMRMISTVHVGGKNGAGMKPTVVAASSVLSAAHSEFGFTRFVGTYPDRPRR
jgi:hypothetical protein